jgi:hypothetical protein
MSTHWWWMVLNSLTPPDQSWSTRTFRGLSLCWWCGLLGNPFYPAAGGPCCEGKYSPFLPLERAVISSWEKFWFFCPTKALSSWEPLCKWAFQITEESYLLQGESTSVGTVNIKAGMGKEKTSRICWVRQEAASHSENWGLGGAAKVRRVLSRIQPGSFIRHNCATRLSPENDTKVGSWEMSLSFLTTWNRRYIHHSFHSTHPHAPLKLLAAPRSFTKPVYLYYRWSSLFSTHSLMFSLPHCVEVES